MHRRAQNLNLLVKDVLALGGNSRASQIATSRVSEAVPSAMVIEEDFMYEPAPLQQKEPSNTDGKTGTNPMVICDDEQSNDEDRESREPSDA